jgi:hypothetical protein
LRLLIDGSDLDSELLNCAQSFGLRYLAALS